MIQRFKKECSDPDGNMKSKNKPGRSGKGSSIACNAARYVSTRSKAEKLNERLWPGAVEKTSRKNAQRNFALGCPTKRRCQFSRHVRSQILGRFTRKGAFFNSHNVIPYTFPSTLRNQRLTNSKKGVSVRFRPAPPTSRTLSHPTTRSCAKLPGSSQTRFYSP